MSFLPVDVQQHVLEYLQRGAQDYSLLPFTIIDLPLAAFAEEKEPHYWEHRPWSHQFIVFDDSPQTEHCVNLIADRFNRENKDWYMELSLGCYEAIHWVPTRDCIVVWVSPLSKQMDVFLTEPELNLARQAEKIEWYTQGDEGILIIPQLKSTVVTKAVATPMQVRPSLTEWIIGVYETLSTLYPTELASLVCQYVYSYEKP